MNIIEIKVQSRRLDYLIQIRSKYTIIRGDSGTGKTTLISLLRRDDTVISSKLNLVPLPIKSPNGGEDKWLEYLEFISGPDTLLYCDEEHPYLLSKKFQSALVNCQAYLLIVSRAPLVGIPYSCGDVYKIKVISSTKNRSVNTVVPAYELKNPEDLSDYSKLYTEDSRSGYLFFSYLLGNVQSCFGKDHVPELIRTTRNTVFLVDELGFGSTIASALESLQNTQHNSLYFIESFESLILHSDWVGSTIEPPMNCKNKEAWYTVLLIQLMASLGGSYNKATVGHCFLRGCCYTSAKCDLFKRGVKAQLVLGDLYPIFCGLGTKVRPDMQKSSSAYLSADDLLETNAFRDLKKSDII